jgi:hypothetical protein
VPISDPLSPESIHRRFVHADLALCLARWILRSWPWIDPAQRAAISYGLNGGAVGNGQVGFAVPLMSLLEALDVLLRGPERDESLVTS